jgi:hypothetical protein
MLAVETYPTAGVWLALFMLAQMAVLLLQDALGSRFFLSAAVWRATRARASAHLTPRAQLAPSRYNYYVRRPVDVERALPAEDVMCAAERARRFAPSPLLLTPHASCVICMAPIDLAAVHMRTPCQHVFHSGCLELVGRPGARARRWLILSPAAPPPPPPPPPPPGARAARGPQWMRLKMECPTCRAALPLD